MDEFDSKDKMVSWHAALFDAVKNVSLIIFHKEITVGKVPLDLPCICALAYCFRYHLEG